MSPEPGEPAESLDHVDRLSLAADMHNGIAVNGELRGMRSQRRNLALNPRAHVIRDGILTRLKAFTRFTHLWIGASGASIRSIGHDLPIGEIESMCHGAREPMREHVIGVAIPADGVITHDRLGLPVGSDCEEVIQRLDDARPGERICCGIGGGRGKAVGAPDHARIGVHAWLKLRSARRGSAQERVAIHPQHEEGRGELGFSVGRQPGSASERRERTRCDLASLTSSQRHQPGFGSRLGECCERTSRGDRLIIGMRVNEQHPPGTVEPCGWILIHYFLTVSYQASSRSVASSSPIGPSSSRTSSMWR